MTRSNSAAHLRTEEFEQPMIPIAGPWITQREVDYVVDAVATNWYSNASDYVKRFEDAFAELCQRRFAVSLPSCTAALHLALAAYGIGPGDEVVVPETTWIASAAPITYVGATPVFVDVEPDTWCLSAASLERAVGPATRAVIAVDLYGGMPDYFLIEELAERHGLIVIEDAAEAVGASLHDRPAGSFGDVSVFSFHGTKTVTTGEGGMLTTDNEELVERVRFLADHGRRSGDHSFRSAEVAFKYRMSALQAALGLAQTERLAELVAKKREIFSWYLPRLGGLLQLNAEPLGSFNSYWMTTALLPEDVALSIEELRSILKGRQIDTRPFFHPLSSLPAYDALGGQEPDVGRLRNPVSYRLSERGINLPSALSLTEKDVDYVAQEVIRILTASERHHLGSV